MKFFSKELLNKDIVQPLKSVLGDPLVTAKGGSEKGSGDKTGGKSNPYPSNDPTNTSDNNDFLYYIDKSDVDEADLDDMDASDKQGTVRSAANAMKDKNSSATISTDKDKLYKTSGDEIVKDPGDAPGLSDLVFESDGGEQLSYISGSLADPNVCHEIYPEDLFLDGYAHDGDVNQFNLGDCYFLSAVLQIVQQDKAKIPSMMKLVGNTVETTLYHQEGILWGTKWVQTKISRPLGIATKVGTKIAERDDGMAGCEVRVDVDNVCKNGWFAGISNNVCKITRRDYHRAALWATCLEQAYIEFTQKYGKYGKGGSKKKAYIGGYPQKCYHMFYGDDASDEDVTWKSWGILTPKAKPVVEKLIEYKKSCTDTDASYMAMNYCTETHAYSLCGVTFRDKDGNELTDLDKIEFTDIDTSQSTVEIRNPWNSEGYCHQHKYGDEEVKDGKFFTLTIDQMLQSGDGLYSASVKIK